MPRTALRPLAVLIVLVLLPGTVARTPEPEPLVDKTDAANCELVSAGRLLENLISPQLEPAVVHCIEVDGNCIVTEEVAAGGGATLWNFFVYARVKLEASVDVTTTIQCSGSFELTSLHYGAAGLRFAETRMLADPSAYFGDSGGTDAALPSINSQVAAVEPCNYLGPFLGCKTVLTGTWAAKQSLQGEVVAFTGNIPVCGGSRTLNYDTAQYLGTALAGSADALLHMSCDSIPAPEI